MSQTIHDRSADAPSAGVLQLKKGGGLGLAALLGIALAVGIAMPAAGQDKPTYTFSGFSPVNQHLAELSGIWDDAPYEAELIQTTFIESVAGLNSGQLLLAHYGITTALRQQSASEPQWTVETSPIKLVYGYRTASEEFPIYPQSSLLVRNDAGIETAADLRGKTWASQIGGDVPTVYLAALQQAGLTPDDITELTADSYGPLVAAFRSGEAHVLAAGPGQVIDLIESGEARVFYTQDELGIAVFPGLAALAASLEDPELEAVIGDFLVRFTRFNEWKEAHPAEHREALITIGQSDERRADFDVAQFQGVASIRFDDVLIDSAQKSVDLLHWAGQVPNPIDPANIWATYDDRFNEATGAVTYLFREYDKSRLHEILEQQAAATR